MLKDVQGSGHLCWFPREIVVLGGHSSHTTHSAACPIPLYVYGHIIPLTPMGQYAGYCLFVPGPILCPPGGNIWASCPCLPNAVVGGCAALRLYNSW